jgi:hypothetical protein
MNTGEPDTFVYLLVDNGLLDEVSASYTETDSNSRPTWLSPIYLERALAVSPLLIDLEAAYEGGDLDQVMHYLNALQPALHVSIIETALDLNHLAKHLRRFIFIVDPNGKQFTFRYADCTILALLPSVLTPGQWAAMHEPIAKWEIHDRSGVIAHMPPADSTENALTPFRLNCVQIDFLDEASEPDHYIAKVKMMHNIEALPGNYFEQHKWSKSARQLWRKVESPSAEALLFLTESAIITKGEILHTPGLEDFLIKESSGKLREILKAMSNRMNA